MGYYTDDYFPEKNVRFIAVNACVDSADGDNELAPFRNVMNGVTPMILQELIDRIEVYAVEGTGLNRAKSVVIHYKFLGELDMPENFDKIKVNTRKGVEVEYLTSTKTA